MSHPTSVVIERKPVIRDRRWTPAFSRRLPVVVETETAPITAVPYSAFSGVGRDPQHSTPHMWRYQALAIQDKLSIAAQFFGVVKTPGAMVVLGSQVGGQNPTEGRTAINSARAGTLDERQMIYPPATYAPAFMKIA